MRGPGLVPPLHQVRRCPLRPEADLSGDDPRPDRPLRHALCADFATVSYNTKIFGTPYNFSHAVLYQIYEIRYCPLAAVLLLAMALAVLAVKRRDPVLWSKVFLAAGVGALGFSFLRLVILQVYRDNLAWFTFWEEVTELLFVAGSGLVLWFFREGLFGERRTPAQRTAQAPEGRST